MKYICIIYIILLLQACGDSKKNNQRTTKNRHLYTLMYQPKHTMIYMQK